tara:strand:+ start:177 stop:587 length:411 start_codon:yes stop_codon:yes gene_type:complete
MDKIPTAPISPLQLPQQQVAISTILRPFIHYDYIVLKRCGLFCYNDCFLLTKKDDTKWNITLYDVGKLSCDIPTDKSNEDMVMIINSLGVKKNSIYRVDVYNRDCFIQKKYFKSVSSIIEFITKNENVIQGVKYSV